MPTLNTELLQSTLWTIKRKKQFSEDLPMPQRVTAATTFWYQGSWRTLETKYDEDRETSGACGTSMCFAGWAEHITNKDRWVVPASVAIRAHKAGDYDSLDDIMFLLRDDDGSTLRDYVDDDTSDKVLLKYGIDPDQGVVTVRDQARRDLGLDSDQAELLFDGGNTLPVIEMIVAGLVAGESVLSLRVKRQRMRIADAEARPATSVIYLNNLREDLAAMEKDALRA